MLSNSLSRAFAHARKSHRAIGLVVAGVLTVMAAPAFAQMGGGMGGGGMGGGGMGGMGGGQPGGPEPEKKAGVAEAAPKTATILPTTPILPAPTEQRKRWKLLELDGYFRTRSVWDKNFNLGFRDSDTLGGSPFPQPTGCAASASAGTLVSTVPCGNSLHSTNIQMRLMPTFNVSEGTSIHTEIDLLNNLVLGSTPEGFALNPANSTTVTTSKLPLSGLSSTQVAPVAGVNNIVDSIAVRRVWAEVALPIGTLQVGRMPNQWGMGISENAGGYDPNTGVFDYDANYGDTVDRAQFSALIPGTKLRASIAADWISSGITASLGGENPGRGGQDFALDPNIATSEYVFTLGKYDTPQEFKDTVERGELALNFGIYAAYRTQDWDYAYSNVNIGAATDASRIINRGYSDYHPDLWAKLGYRGLTLEGELVGDIGTINDLSDYSLTGSFNIRQFGGVGRATYSALDGRLRFGIETGFATGDQWDNTPQGSTYYTKNNVFGGAGDNDLTQFSFNRDYHVDLILWRELYGTVTNAIYAKPFMQFDLTKNITFKQTNVTSFALKPVATPGNAAPLGIEFDSDLGYSGHGIFAGLSFGVLFPLAGLSHPSDLSGNGGTGFNYDITNQGDAGTAYTIQSRLVVVF